MENDDIQQNGPQGWKRGTNMPHLRDYLQRTVGERGRTMVTSATRYESWADLPWEEGQAPDPMPDGRVVLIGMRDTLLGTPGPEAFVALPGDEDELVTAGRLANRLIAARGAPNK